MQERFGVSPTDLEPECIQSEIMSGNSYGIIDSIDWSRFIKQAALQHIYVCIKDGNYWIRLSNGEWPGRVVK